MNQWYFDKNLKNKARKEFAVLNREDMESCSEKVMFEWKLEWGERKPRSYLWNHVTGRGSKKDIGFKAWSEGSKEPRWLVEKMNKKMVQDEVREVMVDHTVWDLVNHCNDFCFYSRWETTGRFLAEKWCDGTLTFL